MSDERTHDALEALYREALDALDGKERRWLNTLPPDSAARVRGEREHVAALEGWRGRWTHLAADCDCRPFPLDATPDRAAIRAEIDVLDAYDQGDLAGNVTLGWLVKTVVTHALHWALGERRAPPSVALAAEWRELRPVIDRLAPEIGP